VRHRSLAGASAVVTLMLLSWPFVRFPSLDLAGAAAWTFVVWAVAVVLCALISQAARKSRPR
jgi:hypothetical protein